MVSFFLRSAVVLDHWASADSNTRVCERVANLYLNVRAEVRKKTSNI